MLLVTLWTLLVSSGSIDGIFVKRFSETKAEGRGSVGAL